jgi:hypothetical protein
MARRILNALSANLTILLASLTVSCFEEPIVPIKYKPSIEAVSDLSANNITATSLQLVWTTPFQNDLYHDLVYDVRREIIPISLDNWDQASRIYDGMVGNAGQQEIVTVADLQPDTDYKTGQKTPSFQARG